ncbi:MAG: hypothetical protein ACI4F0_10185 [Agathobacter sp.]
MDKYYFVGYLGKRVEELHLMDIIDSDDVILVSDNLDERKFKHPRIRRKFEQDHLWNIICDGEPKNKWVWNRFYTLYNFPFEKENMHYIIFWDSAISVYYSEYFFYKLKKKHPNIKLIFYIYDQMNRRYSKRILRMCKYADAIFCTIPEDCKTYGFDYFPLVYSRPIISNQYDFAPSDIYFMGNNSDRDEQLHHIYEYLKAKGVRCDFNIVGVSEERQLYKGEIEYNRNFPETENIARSISTNCILELMHGGMNAVTARYPEAIALNKKILTNNKNVVNEKFYDDRYIRYFENIEDVDIEWIVKRENINYNYNGEYSPRALIETVRRRFE